MTERVARWAIDDIAEDKNSGELYRVIGFIMDPAVIFRSLDGKDQMVQVGGCRNEVKDLIHYEKHEDV